MKKLVITVVSAVLLLAGCDAGSPPTPTVPLPTPTSGSATTPTAASPAPSITAPLEPTATSGQATAATSTPGGPREMVRFAMDWTPNTNHTGIYVAAANGWYKEAGLDVAILPYSDANTPDTLVATGQADFGVSFAESMVTDRVSELPVKSVAAILQTNTSAIATLKGSGLDRPAQLEGKRYAGFGSPYEEPVLKTVLKADGAPTGDFQNITANLSGYQAVAAKQADFVWIYLGWEGIQAQLDGVPLNTFLIKDYGVPDYYTPLIIANEDYLQKKPDVAKKFLEITSRGYEYGITNPTEAADLLIKAAPPGTFLDPELPRRSQQYLAPFYKAGAARWGEQTLQKWTDFPKFLAESGQLTTPDGKVVKPEDIDYSSLFTNDYLPSK